MTEGEATEDGKMTDIRAESEKSPRFKPSTICSLLLSKEEEGAITPGLSPSSVASSPIQTLDESAVSSESLKFNSGSQMYSPVPAKLDDQLMYRNKNQIAAQEMSENQVKQRKNTAQVKRYHYPPKKRGDYVKKIGKSKYIGAIKVLEKEAEDQRGINYKAKLAGVDAGLYSVQNNEDAEFADGIRKLAQECHIAVFDAKCCLQYSVDGINSLYHEEMAAAVAEYHGELENLRNSLLEELGHKRSRGSELERKEAEYARSTRGYSRKNPKRGNEEPIKEKKKQRPTTVTYLLTDEEIINDLSVINSGNRFKTNNASQHLQATLEAKNRFLNKLSPK